MPHDTKYIKILMILMPFLVLGSMTEAVFGIISNEGGGTFIYESIRGQMVEIYGKGVYRHMSSDVALQGIAQDYVTLFVAIPALLVAFFYTKKHSFKAKLVLSGVLLYFTLTYLFYVAIALYNELFLVASLTLFVSLFSFILNMMSFDFQHIKTRFNPQASMRLASLFLIMIAIMMAMLWLSVIVPPMLDGSFYPKTLYHYSTLIVQGYDLGIFLPLAMISGILGLKKNEYAYVLVPTYWVFLSLLMLALLSKIAFMAQAGVNVVPVIFIIPVMFLMAIIFALKIIKNFR